MTRIEIINKLLDQTNDAYDCLNKMECNYGVNSADANEARAAWYELYRLCKSIGLNWKAKKQT